MIRPLVSGTDIPFAGVFIRTIKVVMDIFYRIIR